ncbi:hypothetical protein [Pseudorhizobium marinum]|uniref:hypothetical protein n=1 Tax=Pseudorhizobium marinum TaxID=1496690 RepID=UPI00068D71F7|nr:hypothetical protein [Pseudorhizobium marinum]
MKVLGSTEGGLIRVILDGEDTESYVPDDMSNGHRRMIAEWEAAGNDVPAFSLEPAVAQPLTARQLRLGLVANGIAMEQVEVAIAAIEDTQQRAVAFVEWEYAAQFERDHPLIASIGAALGLTAEQVDAMWAEAI